MFGVEAITGAPGLSVFETWDLLAVEKLSGAPHNARFVVWELCDVDAASLLPLIRKSRISGAHPAKFFSPQPAIAPMCHLSLRRQGFFSYAVAIARRWDCQYGGTLMPRPFVVVCDLCGAGRGSRLAQARRAVTICSPARQCRVRFGLRRESRRDDTKCLTSATTFTSCSAQRTD